MARRFTELTGRSNPFAAASSIGAGSPPTFLNVDGAGNLDRLAGGENDPFEFFRYVGGAYLRETAPAPWFSGYPAGAGTQWEPAAIDGSGEPDIVSGMAARGLSAFGKDDGGNFTVLAGSADPLNGIDAGTSSAPGFADLDGDLEFDRLAGDSLGSLSALTNIGDTFSGAKSNRFAGVAVAALPTFTFAGTSGPDNLTGTESDDYFDLSQGGNDSVNGLSGDDGFYFGATFTSADTVVGGAGSNDQIGLQGDYTGANAVVVSQLNGIEVIALLPGFDYQITVTATAVPIGQTLTLFAAQLGPSDHFTVNAPSNGFQPSGALQVVGSRGADHIFTGDGDDSIIFGPGGFDPAVDQIDAGNGRNVLVLDGHYTLTLTRTMLPGIPLVSLLPGPDDDLATYNLTLSDTLVTGGLLGSTFTVDARTVKTALTIDGSAETNGLFELYGGSGADVLTGGNGSDILYGGLGGDILTSNGSGSGSRFSPFDTYLYEDVAESAGTAYDHLIGLNDQLDKIDLPFAVTGFATPQSGTLDEEVLNAGLENAFAGLGAHQAGVFTATDGDLSGHIYLVVDADGADGYQAGLDYLFEIVSPVTPIDQAGMFI